MSTDTEHVEEGTETSVLETWEEWYHLPVLGVVMLFMLWVRTQSYDRFVTDDGTPALAAVDSWYHWRTIEWTAENYPYTMPYEIWTSFPDGRYVGQFGTLFDQIIVTAAMIVGLGDPSTGTLYTVSLLAVPVMAALVAIPVFYIGRRLGGTIGGLVAIVLLALAPGQFLNRTTAGQLQHHVAEVLFMALAVLTMMAALRVAEREKPIWELVVDGDTDPLRKPALYSVLAGISLSLYIWMWPPGVVLIGIFGVFFAVALCIDYVRGVSPDHVAFVGTISLGLTAVITALLIEEPGTSVTSFGYLQPVSAALVAVGCVFMAWFARQWNKFDVDRRYYPAAIGGLIVVSFGAMAIILPDFYSTFVSNLQGRVLPIGERGAGLTIAEAQPPSDYTAHVFGEFRAAFYTMLAGLALLAARPFLGREYRTEYTLIIVWSLFLISMSMTQIRFAYYLVLAVAVVNAVFVADVVRLFNLDIRGGIDSLRQVETYQIIVLVMVVMLLFMPLLPPVAGDGDTAWDRGERTGPSNDAMAWEEPNHWLNENSPEPGDWGGAGNADQLEYYGTYDIPDDGSYDYPEGTYGVISWWDYGHLITTQAERIPHSNPFQSNARSSSAFLTADDEYQAELVLEAIAAGESPSTHDIEELEAMAEDPGHEEMRYVMIDDQMAGGKFNAMATWTGPEPNTYFDPQPYTIGEGQEDLPAPNEQYYDTMTASLYLEDANDLAHYRLVHEASEFSVIASQLRVDQQTGQAAPNPRTSERLGEGEWADFEDTAQQMDLARMTDETLEMGGGAFLYEPTVASSVKTFERVDGATITGTVDASEIDDNATVTASVPLETNTDREFTYTQDVDLEGDTFELTVPYATDEDRGVDDGYTDSAVSATDEYTVSVETETVRHYEGGLEVAESAIYDGEELEVDLEEVDEEIEDDPDGELEDDLDGDLEDDLDEEVEENGDEDGDLEEVDEEIDETETTESIAPVTAPRAD